MCGVWGAYSVNVWWTCWCGINIWYMWYVWCVCVMYGTCVVCMWCVCLWYMCNAVWWYCYLFLVCGVYVIYLWCVCVHGVFLNHMFVSVMHIGCVWYVYRKLWFIYCVSKVYIWCEYALYLYCMCGFNLFSTCVVYSTCVCGTVWYVWCVFFVMHVLCFYLIYVLLVYFYVCVFVWYVWCVGSVWVVAVSVCGRSVVCDVHWVCVVVICMVVGLCMFGVCGLSVMCVWYV